jgi:DNA-binding helix-hairpin-helix protein with protein kinase domain
MHPHGALVDAAGADVVLDEEIGSGGEGSVYRLRGSPAAVAKIYHAAASADKASKLAALTAVASPALTGVASWPIRTVFSKRTKATVGIVMPRVVQHDEIHTLYSPAHRKVTFPQADWSFLIRAARNCAVAFDVIHGCGHVIGDVNQGGILVSKRATITLIDCDSFQVRQGGHLFPCDVGVPHFTPPELQGRSFKGLHRTQDHDRFGLAILVFHLLFMGRHPFVGRFLGKGDLPIEQAIVEGRFAFSQDAARMQMMPPPFALRLQDASTEIATLFERAFRLPANGQAARPAAAEWARALDALERSLIRCARYAAHKFHGSLAACPWCQIEHSGGPDLFVALTAAARLGGKFDLDRIWAAISASQLPAPPTIVRPVASNGPPLTSAQLFWANATAAAAVVALMLLLAGAWIPDVGVVAAAVAAVWLAGRYRSPYSREKRRRLSALRDAATAVDRLEAEIKSAAEESRRGYRDQRTQLERARAEYLRLPSESVKPGEELKGRQRETQLNAHLRRHFIDKAKIQGIGPGLIATLRSYGVETALDINRSIRVPGFGPARLRALLAWRATVARTFRFDPDRGVDPAELNALRQAQATRRRSVEAILENGASQLASLAATTNTRYGSLEPAARVAVQSLAAAEAAAKELPNRIGLA